MREGDTFGGIAARFKVSMNDLKRSNPAVHPERLKIGATLSIPRAASTQASRPAISGGLSVRAGDTDVSIARRLGVPVGALHAANPGTNWRRIQIGQTLRVPSGGSKVARAPVPAAGGAYKVRPGDNDWVIARRVGATPAGLRRLNPGVNWTRLQIGQSLNVPGGSSPSTVAAIRTKRAKIVKDNVILRRKPSTQSDRVALADAGKVGGILDRENGWYKLRLAGGYEGWVRGDLLQPVSAFEAAPKRVASKTRSKSPIVRSDPRAVASLKSSVRGNALLETAARYRGVRYRYGGTTSRGFDCSGFVSHVFKSQGIRLPRTSREQSTIGRPVPKGNLKRGDLVFFKTRGSRISHVGIYIGAGKFIHSSSGGGTVRTDSLNEGYYNRRFAGARRVAKSVGSEREPSNPVRVAVAAGAAARDQAPPPAPEPRKRVSVGTDEISR